MSHDSTMLIFCLSSAFLEVRDVTSLLQCSKAMWAIRDSVQTAFLGDGAAPTTARLLQVKRLFPTLSELSMHIEGEWNLDWGALEHLSRLHILGSARASRTTSETQLFTKTCRLGTLTLERICGSQCNGLYLFIAQFRALRSLSIHRSSPLLLAGISKSIEALSCLEELQLSECFTDAGVLSLSCLRKLKRLRLMNCPNISAIFPNNHLDSLAELVFENVRIGSLTLEVMLQLCPVLKSLHISKCGNLRGAVVIAHRHLRSLQLLFCSHICSAHITCPSLSDLRMSVCYSLQSCTIMSDRLVALDLSQHNALMVLHLQCFRLSSLDLTGCSNISLNMAAPEPSTSSTRAPGSDRPAADLEDLLGKISLAYQSEDALSDSDRSSSRSARLVSSRSVLDSAQASTPFDSEECTERSCERLLTTLQTGCPALDLLALIVTSIRGTALDEHRDLLLKKAEVLIPHRHEPAVLVDHTSSTVRSARSPVCACKKVRPDTKGGLRKPRRAKK